MPIKLALLVLIALSVGCACHAAEPPISVWLVFSSKTLPSDRSNLAGRGRMQQRQPITNTTLLIQPNTDYWILTITTRTPDAAVLAAFESQGSVQHHKTIYLDEFEHSVTGAVEVRKRDVQHRRLPDDINESWITRRSTP
jgi:hypothetical protein